MHTSLTEAGRLVEIAALVEEQKADDIERITQERSSRVFRVTSLEAGIDAGFYDHATTDNTETDDVHNDRLTKAIDDLPEAQRDVINALFYERVTEAGLAERLGISRALVRKRRDQALASLRSQFGFDLPASA